MLKMQSWRQAQFYLDRPAMAAKYRRDGKNFATLYVLAAQGLVAMHA